uniref:Uncharacterized protein n=1 Tax=Fusarium begoniae TaxID=48487 RepID=A0A6M4B1Z1_9HYPO|nr:hypothetical protein [Fusarium begoniae]
MIAQSLYLKIKNNADALLSYFRGYMSLTREAILSFTCNKYKEVYPLLLWIVFTLSIIYILVILLYITLVFYDSIIQYTSLRKVEGISYTLNLEPIAKECGSTFLLNTPPNYDSSPLSLLVIIGRKFMGLFLKNNIHSSILKPNNIYPVTLELKNTYYINKAHALLNNTQESTGRELEGKAILFWVSCFKYALGVLESQASQAKEK